MTNKNRVYLLFVFFFLSISLAALSSRSLHAIGLDDEDELRSTIKTDPAMKGKKATPQTLPSKAAALPASPAPAESAAGDESKEWQTMRSESTAVKFAVSGPKVDVTKKMILTGKIAFKLNSEKPTADSMKVLKQLAAFLNKKTDLRVRIEGHSDSVGPDQKNFEMSQQRAEKVKEVLVKEGVTAERLQTVGMGDKNPIASNVTPEGQEKNRRVEFHLMESARVETAPTSPPALPPPTTMTPPPPVAPAATMPSSPATAPASKVSAVLPPATQPMVPSTMPAPTTVPTTQSTK